MFKIENTPDQTGKIAIVTGANIGLGFETAIGLVKKNCKVIIASRNSDKAEKAKNDILKIHPGADLEIILLDLSSKASIAAFAQNFKNKYEKLDLLINNAGIMIPPYRETEDGFESQLGVNHLGHFYLTGLLLEHLNKAENARVVSLSSLAHDNATIFFENPNQKEGYKPMKSYGQSKLACLMFAYELQRKLDKAGSSTISIASHPGVALTNLFTSAPKWMQFIAPLFKFMMHPAADGAKPTLMAALDTQLKGGEYVGPTGRRGMRGEPGIVDSNQISQDGEACEKLWKMSEEMLDYKFNF
jgi:NAD(P)-dependent dehydrogenase (short-subunit alcohol dehydrogenase family)